MPIDADQIVPGLWQGSIPPLGDVLARHGFDVVVLCAVEWQFPSDMFKGVAVIHAPNNDDGSELTRNQLDTAIRAAKQVTSRIRDGQIVLSTCAVGMNRSGLVSALTLHFLNGWSGWYCREVVRAGRKFTDGRKALSSQYFTDALMNLPGIDPEQPVHTLNISL